MAHYTKEQKAQIAPQIKEILKRYGLKGSLSIRDHSTVCLKIKSGSINFLGNYADVCYRQNRHLREGLFTGKYIQVNPYWYHEHFTGEALGAITELMIVLNENNFDHSDTQTDYVHVGWYVSLNIGTWDRPYEFIA